MRPSTGFVGLVLVVAVPSGPPTWAATTLTRQPYVQNLGRTHVTIMWRTATPSVQLVEFGVHKLNRRSASAAAPTTHHEITLDHLEPGRTYQYRISELGAHGRSPNEISAASPTYSFTTDSGRDDVEFGFFVTADIGVDKQPQQQHTHDALQSLDPPVDFGLFAGDIVYPNGASERYDAQLMQPWAELLARKPVWPALGNHDWRSDPSQNFEVEWSLPGNEHYYSFDYGNAHFIALDTQSGSFYDAPNQLAWLELDLATSVDATWTFVFFHHPLLSCTYKGNEKDMAAQAMPLFERYGVDVVFTGHAHTFERLYPIVDGQPVDQDQDPVYVDPAGPIYIVSGCGGKTKTGEPTTYCGPTAAFLDERILFTSVYVRDRTLHILTADSFNKHIVDLVSVTKSLTTSDVELATPSQRRLRQNVPNPFNPTTMIPFTLPRPAFVRMNVYASDGTWVANLAQRRYAPGAHRVVWHGVDDSGARVASGVYVVKLETNTANESVKMILVR